MGFYKVKKRKDLQIFLGWSGIFFSHKLAIELRKKLGQNSRKKIINNYTTEIIKDSYLKIFDS